MKKVLTILVIILIAAAWAFTKFRAAKLEVENPKNKKQTLHLFAMSDYFPPEALSNFETKFNCEVRYDNFSSNEDLLAKLQAGATGYDVIVPSDYMVRALINGKLLTELDKSKLPNFKNLAKDFVQVPYDPGSHYSIPYT